MDVQKIISQTEDKLDIAVDRFDNELKKLRTGRASSAMLDGIKVDAYGAPMPLNQLANIVAPEAQLLQVTPFDSNNLQAISNAIRNNQSLGLNPVDDGRVVRISIPPLTEERRREISKQVGARLEEAMIVMRSVRHESIDVIEKAKKDKEIGEDEAKRLSMQVEELMSKIKIKSENLAKAKEQEIMAI